MAVFLKDRLYSEDHEWVLVDGDVAYIGISDYAQEQLGDVVFVELPEEGEEFETGDFFSVIDSVKATSDIYAPVDFEVLEANEELLDAPELLNEDAFENWIVKIKLSDESHLDDLMNAAEYEEFCAEEE